VALKDEPGVFCSEENATYLNRIEVRNTRNVNTILSMLPSDKTMHFQLSHVHPGGSWVDIKLDHVH
jgi:hypothetical protein